MASFDYTDEYTRQWFMHIYHLNKNSKLNRLNISSEAILTHLRKVSPKFCCYPDLISFFLSFCRNIAKPCLKRLSVLWISVEWTIWISRSIWATSKVIWCPKVTESSSDFALICSTWMAMDTFARTTWTDLMSSTLAFAHCSARITLPLPICTLSSRLIKLTIGIVCWNYQLKSKVRQRRPKINASPILHLKAPKGKCQR